MKEPKTSDPTDKRDSANAISRPPNTGQPITAIYRILTASPSQMPPRTVRPYIYSRLMVTINSANMHDFEEEYPTRVIEVVYTPAGWRFENEDSDDTARQRAVLFVAGGRTPGYWCR